MKRRSRNMIRRTKRKQIGGAPEESQSKWHSLLDKYKDTPFGEYITSGSMSSEKNQSLAHRLIHSLGERIRYAVMEDRPDHIRNFMIFWYYANSQSEKLNEGNEKRTMDTNAYQALATVLLELDSHEPFATSRRIVAAASTAESVGNVVWLGASAAILGPGAPLWVYGTAVLRAFVKLFLSSSYQFLGKSTASWKQQLLIKNVNDKMFSHYSGVGNYGGKSSQLWQDSVKIIRKGVQEMETNTTLATQTLELLKRIQGEGLTKWETHRDQSSGELGFDAAVRLMA